MGYIQRVDKKRIDYKERKTVQQCDADQQTSKSKEWL